MLISATGTSYLLLLRVELAIDEHPTIQVLLSAVAKLLVLVEDLLVESNYVLELLVTGILVTVNLVLNLAGRCCHWDHPLDVKEVVTVRPGQP
jgi:hypothetical protein